jgi:hypothetical protein
MSLTAQVAPSPVRLLLADVDGTLVTKEKRLTDRAVAAVRALADAGIAFAVTSGRPPLGMKMLVEPLKLRTPLAAFNGGAFVHPDLTPIDERLIPAGAAAQIAGVIEAHGLDVWVYAAGSWYVRDAAAPHVEHEARTVHFPPVVVPSLEPHLGRAVKVVGVSDDYAAIVACEADLRRELGAVVSATRSQPYYLDVTHPEANKGAVVRRLSQLLGIPTGQIATIGDMPNDVLMFEVGGLSIAMGNASPEVQARATCLTADNEHEGFARAVEQFILPRPDRGRPPHVRLASGDQP